MGFNINHEEAGTFEVLPEGTVVEVFPTVFDKETAQNSGNKMVVVNYKIRDDIEQPGKGREIKFDRFVETPAAMWRVQAASKAAQMENGRNYEDIYDWAADFMGQPLRVVLGIREHNGNEYNEVKSFKESEIGGQAPATEQSSNNDDPFANDGATINITDDDLPF